MYGVCSGNLQKPHSPAGRAVHAQLENDGQGLAESTPGTTGDSGLDLGVIIHLRSSATQHVRFHFNGSDMCSLGTTQATSPVLR